MHEPISKKHMFMTEQQKVVLQDFDSIGYILDIGGGGEGIIGILKGDKVIAIDIRKDELEETPEGSLKIVMDARDLQFLDNTFNTVTAFFSFMYMKHSDHRKVFEEIFRVLKPGGKVLIWDVVIPPRESDKVLFVVSLKITVHEKEIETGYGTKWEGSQQDINYYTGLGDDVGFITIDRKEKGHIFYLKLKKP